MNTVSKTLICCSLLLLTACSGATNMREARSQYDQQNYAIAYDELLTEAKRGNAEAQYAVGYMSYYGIGTAKDERLARQWIRQSADQGYPEAQQALKMVMHDKVSDHPETVPAVPTNQYQPNTKSRHPVVEWFRKTLKKKELV